MNIVVAGAGSVGCYLVERLVMENHNVVVIDQRAKVLEDLSQTYDISSLTGSASSLECLKDAGLESADLVIAATDSDETNLITCLLAHSINESLRKIARVKDLVTDESGLSPRIREVFDHFINPDQEAAKYLLRLIDVPGSSEVIDLIEGKVRVVGLSLNGDCPVLGKELRELASEEAANILIVAIIRENQLIVPDGETIIEPNDTVYVACERERAAEVVERFRGPVEPIRSAMIWGGQGFSQELALSLVKRGIKVKLLESEVENCVSLANELNKVLVLNGDGTDQELLRQEGIEDVDMYIGATAHEEDNILSALLAKSLGARRGAVVLHKKGYSDLVRAVGIDMAVNPRIIAASSILKFVRSDDVRSVFTIRDDTAEVLEIVATEKSRIVGHPLRKVEFPPNALVAVVVDQDDHVTIPTGDTVIEVGHKVIVVAQRTELPKLKKLLNVTFD